MRRLLRQARSEKDMIKDRSRRDYSDGSFFSCAHITQGTCARRSTAKGLQEVICGAVLDQRAIQDVICGSVHDQRALILSAY